MTTRHCLLRNLTGQSLCAPTNPIYVGLHGANGKGGRVGAAGIPRDYAGVLLADSPASKDQAKTYAKLDSYVKSFEKYFEDTKQALAETGESDDSIQIKSLYLWSESPGTGKTTTAIAVLHEWILRTYIGYLKRRQTPPQRLGYFLDANELQKEYSAFNRPKVPETIAEPAAKRYYESLERGKHTPFVVIDDVGMRSSTDGFRGDLHDVINHRVTNEMPTVYTSNLPIISKVNEADRVEALKPYDLIDVYGEKRLADRIKDMTLPIHFNGDSRRGIKRGSQ